MYEKVDLGLCVQVVWRDATKTVLASWFEVDPDMKRLPWIDSDVVGLIRLSPTPRDIHNKNEHGPCPPNWIMT